VHADVARETFELPGEREQLARLLLGLLALRQARLHLARILQGDALAGLEGNKLRQFVRARVAPFHDPPDVAHHGARRHRAEGRDLRNRLRAVFRFTYSITRSRPRSQKSMSKSGIDTRSGFRKRSNRRS
jgi:hypothetical protein